MNRFLSRPSEYYRKLTMLMLGLCPLVALATTFAGAFAVGATTILALVISNVIVTALQRFIPAEVRGIAHLIISAIIVSVAAVVLDRVLPAVFEEIGTMLPLVAVCCLALSKLPIEDLSQDGSLGRKTLYALADGALMGGGFAVFAFVLGGSRQILDGLGMTIFSKPAGGFVVFGLLLACILAIFSVFEERYKKAGGKSAEGRFL